MSKHNWMRSLLLPSCLMGLALLSGCKDDDLTEPSVPETPGFVYDLSVDKVQTRALAETADKKISATFETGDPMLVFSSKQVAEDDKNTQTAYSFTTALQSGKRSRFSGSITTGMPFTMDDELYFLFPGVDRENSDILAAAEWAEEKVGEGSAQVTVNFWNKAGKVRPHVMLSMENQDGTLETIGKKFDYQWAKGKPKTIVDSRIDTYIGGTQRLVAFLRLSFRDKEGRYLKNIDRVTISNVNCFDVFDLTTGKVTTQHSMNTNANTINIEPVAGRFNPTEENRLYVALFPGHFKDVVIAAYADGVPHVYTYPNLYISADKYYTLDVAGMDVQPPHKYVEVQGVKWATGNFIRVLRTNLQTPDYPDGVYFGVAPTQWWIADYFMDNSADGRKRGSQHANNYRARVSELDLWRYGDIANYRSFASGEGVNHPKYDISKKWFTKGIRVDRNITTNPQEAKYGDIAYYYTWDKRNVYRYPTKEEFDKLMTQANCYPAYCYSDKGNKIYGAYFTTCHDNNRYVGFPTGQNRLYKYVDVSAPVMANRGLFLPITGMRRANGSGVPYRDVNYMLCYGQYMCAWQNMPGITYIFNFGPSAWRYATGILAQGNALRPVWDGENTNVAEPSLFPAFEGIYKVVKGDKSIP